MSYAPSVPTDKWSDLSGLCFPHPMEFPHAIYVAECLGGPKVSKMGCSVQL